VKPLTGGDTIIVDSSDVVQDFYGLCVGDVNASNIPDPGKSTMPSVTLQHDGIIEVVSGNEAEVPVFIKTSAEIGAISIILENPASALKVVNVEVLQHDVMFEEVGNEIRIAWSEINPLKVNPDEPFMKIKVKVDDNIPAGREILFSLTTNSEISDGLALPVFPATLSMPVLKVTGAGNGADEILSNVFLFPNPANQWISISYLLAGPAEVTVEIFNPYGQIRCVKQIAQTMAGSYQQNFDISDFSSGLYFVRITATLRQTEYVKTMRMIIGK
jgi:hypothetical protein